MLEHICVDHPLLFHYIFRRKLVVSCDCETTFHQDSTTMVRSDLVINDLDLPVVKSKDSNPENSDAENLKSTAEKFQLHWLQLKLFSCVFQILSISVSKHLQHQLSCQRVSPVDVYSAEGRKGNNGKAGNLTLSSPQNDGFHEKFKTSWGSSISFVKSFELSYSDIYFPVNHPGNHTFILTSK